MAITGPASYLLTTTEFLAHWAQCNAALPPQSPLQPRLPENNTTVTRAQLLALRTQLQNQQITVQSRLTDQGIARGVINLQKEALLEKFNQFNARLDAFYRKTRFYELRPYAPSPTDGQEAFTRPVVDAMTLWEKINVGPAPAGVTLPLALPDGTDQGAFASAVSALQFAYQDEQTKAQETGLARADRNLLQTKIYAILKAYRETVPGSGVREFPALLETLPRLTPAPGHTPAAVNASAVFTAPNVSKVVYDASTDGLLHSYQLRGNVGGDYSDEDAIVIATHTPGEAREFLTPFGLNQPGAQVALKVYVILTTGNEAGSGAMLVHRPANVQSMAA